MLKPTMSNNTPLKGRGLHLNFTHHYMDLIMINKIFNLLHSKMSSTPSYIPKTDIHNT